MPRSLVIVESPAKARTLGRFLGHDYAVRASLGHVRDLPRDRLAVDTARGFVVEYEVLPSRRRVLAELRTAAREADTVYLAADPDREGEAICWHLAEELAPFAARARFRRVSFHEITRPAVEAAFRTPGEIDPRRVDAQQTRRILDRLVGYSLSPLLWTRFQSGLSAGRVQSVALRLVCERERAIAAFVPEESWTIRARLQADAPPPVPATLVADPPVRTAEEAERLRRELESASFVVRSVTPRERRRAAPPPFVTSTLQQEAFRRLRFPVKKTMQIAQRLYEGVELGAEGPLGLITYMRTDSTRVSAEAAAAAQASIARSFGPEYLPGVANAFSSPAAAQEAHEAIRPTDLARTPVSLAGRLARDELALYTLVFERFLASQMAAAVYDETLVEIEARAADGAHEPPRLLRAKGSTLRFRGFLAAHEESPEEAARGEPPATAPEEPEAPGPLPPLRAGQPLALAGVDTRQRFSEPPPRFDEASLVRELERRGIGRPSTYATIVSTLLDRDYVERPKGRLRPTPLGLGVIDLLVARFPELLSVGYTAEMEQSLDAIAEGRATLLATLGEFWRRLQPALAAAAREGGAEPAEPAPERDLGRCPQCGSGLERRQGRYGVLVGCRRFPACRYIRKNAPAAGMSCPLCHTGRVVERVAAEHAFFGCSRYPACRFTSNHRPLAESCPECGSACLYEKDTARDGRVVYCGNESCHYHR